MTLLHWLLYSALPALALALLLVGVLGPRLIGLAIATSVIVPYALLKAMPPWPWVMLRTGGSGEHWLCWGVVAAGLVATLHDLRLWPRPLGTPPAVALLLAVPWFLAEPLRRGWTFERSGVHLLVAGGLFGAVWLALRGALANGAGLGVVAASLLALTGDSLVLNWKGQPVAISASSAAVVLFAVLLAATWRKAFAVGEGACLAVAIVHGGTLLHAYYEQRLAPLVALLLWIAPVPLWLLVRKGPGKGAQGSNGRILGGLALAVLCEGVAFVLGCR